MIVMRNPAKVALFWDYHGIAIIFYYSTTIICPKIQPGFISNPQWIGIRQPWNEHITLSETHVGRQCNLLLLKSAMKGNGTAVIANPLRKVVISSHQFYAIMRSTRLTCNFQLWFSREDFVFSSYSHPVTSRTWATAAWNPTFRTSLDEVEMLSWLAWPVRHVTRLASISSCSGRDFRMKISTYFRQWRPMHSMNHWPHGKAIGFGLQTGFLWNVIKGCWRLLRWKL